MTNEFKNYNLKPCPFCGREPTTTVSDCYVNDDWYNLYLISCEDCDIGFSSLTYIDEVVDKWNTRYNEEENNNAST